LKKKIRRGVIWVTVLAEKAEKTHGLYQSGISVFRPRLDSAACRIQNKYNHARF